jgi:PilZ domain
MSGADKRRDPRVDTQQSVWVEGQEMRVEAEARNMSRSGMFVVTRASLAPPAGTLDITFDDPHEGPVQIKMEVMWRADESVGSRLGLKLAAGSDAEAFERVVSRLLSADEQEEER